MDADRYLARICWNTKNWVRPTGEAAQIEHGETYNATRGFGHEEWLFNFEWVLDGWKYAFLQPVNRSLAKVQGKTLNVRLYTISPERIWFYVGHLHHCEVLTEEIADAARREFWKRGWLKDMERHLKHVGGDIEGLRYPEATLLFNIRFRPGDAEQYDPMVPVGPKDAIRKLRRYTLVSVEDDVVTVEKQWASRVAATQLRPTGKRSRAGQAPAEVDLVQNQLQNDLFALLLARYGREAVVMEEGFVDIKLRKSEEVTLIEVKSDGRPRYAIREALGQLLEYAFACETNGERVTEMIVAGPGEVGPRDAEYIEHLRVRRALPVRYVCVRRGIDRVDV